MKARTVAYECLCKIMIEGQYANLMMRNALEKAESVDKGLITQIVYGTLRHYRMCRFQWVHFTSKPCNPRIAILIDMSVYQLLYMDKVPTYAIFNEAVDLAEQSSKGFVNAILRKVQVQGRKESNDASIQTSHPAWLMQMWNAHYGKEITEQMSEWNNQDAVVVGRVNTIKCDKSEIEKIEGVQFLDDTAFVADFNLVQNDLFKEGKIIIQDESSQQVVKVMELEKGMKILDCCSAPGTKTSQIAMVMENTGSIIACELHEHRSKLIQDLMEKMGVTNTTIITKDACHLYETLPSLEFDRILVDAPCSGLGVLRRKPEIKQRITPESIDEIVQLQGELLKNVECLLKVNGLLIYSTCTLNKKENEKQIAKFMKEHENYELIYEKTIFPDLPTKDGFYMAKLLKTR